MSQPILTLLREHAAFKPKPPEYELAIAHVPLGQVGLENPIDDRVLEAMCSDDESFTIVLAPPGCGKTSALSAAAMHCAGRSSSTTNNSRAKLGLDHYEGRSWLGWYHHTALVTAVHGFLTLERQHPNHQRPA